MTAASLFGEVCQARRGGLRLGNVDMAQIDRTLTIEELIHRLLGPSPMVVVVNDDPAARGDLLVQHLELVKGRPDNNTA